MFRILFRDFIIVLVSAVLLIVTLPILAGEINEDNFPKEDYEWVISTLPENKEIILTENLPENEDVVRIKKIVIDLSEQKLYLYENGEAVIDYLVSTGKPGMWTPTGEFQIHNKNKRAWSNMASLWMPFWMMIEPNKGIGIHELPEWPSGYKEGSDHLGQPVSHGCIRLGVGAAEKVYNWAEIGTKVEIID